MRTIQIHPAAPDKPKTGEKCNGCGVCCASEPCPVSALLLTHRQDACPALVWHDVASIYRCGMLQSPSQFCRWLPIQFDPLFIFLARRWLAIGIGCDSEVDVET